MPESKALDVICLGYAAIDYLAVVPKMPEIDTKLLMEEFSIQGGGPAATAAVTASRLGAKTAFIGQVGDDYFANYILSEFEKESLDYSNIIRCSNTRSRFSFILVDKSTGKRTIIWHRSEMPPINPNALNEEFFSSCKVLHLDRHEIAAGIQASKWVRKSGGIVSLDAGTYESNIEVLLPYIDVLISSYVFARDATNEDDPMKAANKLLNGRMISGVTCGEQGSYFATQEECFYVPAFKVDVVDTTGAGDVFHGAFAYGLSRNWDAKKCATFASAVAAIKCTMLGGRAGIPTLEQVNAFLSDGTAQ